MAAALVLPISGPYIGLYDALPLGTQNDDGFELIVTLSGQEINETDAYGMTLVEGIYRGQSWRVRFRGLEWAKTGLQVALQAFGGDITGATFAPQLTEVGARWSSNASTLLLTAILGNPPTFPQTLTALLASWAPNFQSSFLFTSKMREWPLEMVLMPYTAVSPSRVIAFSTT